MGHENSEESDSNQRRAAEPTAKASPNAPAAAPLWNRIATLDLPPGTMVGPYKILSLLGEGGFGVVYLAQRSEPHDQRVALKIIKPGMDSRAVIARFEQERQALAVMDHPNVARVFDAGATPVGRPYFVMQYVKGEPITEYCDRHTLTIRQRLELFIPVCEAVQHAHMKGIIHRDISPSNVLVSIVDGQPMPTVIDFGVAKAIAHTLTEKTIFTEQGLLIGSQEYMSPEQAQLGAIDVDTRTDVYSLGVILYELLSGALPFDPIDLRRNSFDEIRRVIREVDPPRPSAKLSSLSPPSSAAADLRLEGGGMGAGESSDGRITTAHDIAQHRQTRVDALATQLRRELEWIPLKAIRKDRDRRYATAKDLADDVRNYLDGRPLLAGPETGRYRLKKWLARHRGPVAAASVLMLALVLGLAGTTLGLVRARHAEAQATLRAKELKQVTEFQSAQLRGIDVPLMGARLRDDLKRRTRVSLASAGRDETGISADLAELDRALAGINFTSAALKTIDENIFESAIKAAENQFGDQPLVKAHLLHSMVMALIDLGLLDRAKAPLAEALQIHRSVLGDDHLDTLSSMSVTGSLLNAQGRLVEAEPYLRRTLEKRRRLLGDDDPDTLNAINNLALLLKDQGKLAESEPHFRESLERRRRLLGDDDRMTLTAMNNLGGLLDAQGKDAEAEPFYRETLDRRRRVLGHDHSETLNSINTLGIFLKEQGKFSEAEPLLLEALEGSRRVLGDLHPITLSVLRSCGTLLRAEGKLQEAEPYYRLALETSRRVLGGDHPDTLGAMSNLGSLLKSQRKLDEAEPYLLEAMEGSRRILGSDHPDTIVITRNYGMLLRAQGKTAEAEPYYRQVLDTSRRVLGDDHPNTLIALNNMGSLIMSAGRLDEAEPYLVEAVQVSKAKLGPTHPTFLSIGNTFGGLLRDQGRFAEAESMLLSVQAGTEAIPSAAQLRTMSVGSLIKLYEAWNKAQPGQGYDAKATQWRIKLKALRQQARAASQATDPGEEVASSEPATSEPGDSRD